MRKINKPEGLIRHTSENAIKHGVRFKINTRIIGYSIVLLILMSTTITLLAIRSNIETTVLRTPGLLYQKQGEDMISNIYTIQLVNKTFNDIPIELRLREPKGEIKWVGDGISNLTQQSITSGEFFLYIPKSEITKTKTKLKFDVYSNGEKLDDAESSFLGPNN